MKAVIEDLVRQYRSGASLRVLAERQGCSRETTRRQLLAAGVELRGAPTLPVDPSWWADQLAAGQTVADLAVQLGVHTMTVYRRLRACGLPNRPAPADLVLSPAWLAARTRPEGACRRWTGSHTTSGYGYTPHKGEKVLVHRLVWEHAHGPIPAGHELTRAEECPHLDCVQLTHLQALTPAARIQVQVEAGSFAHGERHWNAHLTEADARTILASHEPARTLAERHRVSINTVRSIRARRRWKHL